MPNRPQIHRPSYAPKNEREARQRYQQHRPDKDRQAFYQSKRWRKVSKQYKQEHRLCADCHRAGRVTAVAEVHHTTRLEELLLIDKELAYDFARLEGLCKPCHSKRTNRGE